VDRKARWISSWKDHQNPQSPATPKGLWITVLSIFNEETFLLHFSKMPIHYRLKSCIPINVENLMLSGSTPRGQDIQFITPKYPFQFVPDFFLCKVDEIRYNKPAQF
jgi:hypothetical protein